MPTLAQQRRRRALAMADRRERQGKRLAAAMRTRLRRLVRQGEGLPPGWVGPHDQQLRDLGQAYHRTRRRNARRRPRRTVIKRPRLTNRQSRARRAARDYYLTPAEVHRFLSSSRQVGQAAIARAMGITVPVPKHLLNPKGASMARSRRNPRRPAAKARGQAQLSLRPMARAAAARPRDTRSPMQKAADREMGEMFAKGKDFGMGDMFAMGPKGYRAHRRRIAADRSMGRLFAEGPPKRRKKKKAAARRPKRARSPGRKTAARRKPRAAGGRSAAQRRAFARMQAGLRRWRASSKSRSKRSRPHARRRAAGRRSYPLISARASYSGKGRPPRGFRSRRAAASRRRKAGHKNLSALRPIRRGQRIAGLVRRNNPKRGDHMARRRRRHNPGHRRRRHNPGGIKGAIMTLGRAAIPGAIGGAVAGIVDSKLPAHWGTLPRISVKLAAAAAGGMALRNKPMAAASFIGAMVGTSAYEAAIRVVGGGTVAATRPAGMKELASMAAEDEQSLGLLQSELSGLGLLEGAGDLEPNLGDVEPSLGDEVEGMGEDAYSE